MENTEKEQIKFGLVGKNISYSFSRGYFEKKFQNLKLENYSYQNFDIQNIEEFTSIFNENNSIKGLNVTIPFKEEIIPFLDTIEKSAMEIGAVNTIKINEKGLEGFNTDAFGFQKSLEPLLKSHHKKALILGTGGASKAVAYVLSNLGIDYAFVSRSGKNNGFTYSKLKSETIMEHKLIVNCSPVGTFPKIDEKPDLPYSKIGSNHILYDLIYNPAQTAFLKEGEKRGATIQNGLKMLELQAEKAWSIWNS